VIQLLRPPSAASPAALSFGVFLRHAIPSQTKVLAWQARGSAARTNQLAPPNKSDRFFFEGWTLYSWTGWLILQPVFSRAFFEKGSDFIVSISLARRPCFCQRVYDRHLGQISAFGAFVRGFTGGKSLREDPVSPAGTGRRRDTRSFSA